MIFVCSDDNGNSDGRLFFLDNEGRMTFSVCIPSARPSAGEVGGVEYVSTSSDILGRQIYSSVIIGQVSNTAGKLVSLLIPKCLDTLYVSASGLDRSLPDNSDVVAATLMADTCFDGTVYTRIFVSSTVEHRHRTFSR